MSNPFPGPVAILHDLERLRRLADDLASDAVRLQDSVRQRDGQAHLRTRATEKSIADSLESHRAEAARLRDAARESAEARALQRSHRIREAQRNARKSGLERLDADEGKHKFDLQREMLRATRERDAGHAAADAALAAFSANLDAAQADLANLEAQAQTLLGVYGRRHLRHLAQAHESAQPDLTPTESTLAEQLHSTLATLHHDLDRFRRRWLPRFSRLWPLWLIVALSPAVIIPTLRFLAVTSPSLQQILAADAAFVALAATLHLAGLFRSSTTLRSLVAAIGQARVLLQACRDKSTETHRRERARLDQALDATTQQCNDGWSRIVEWLEESRSRVQSRADTRAARALDRNENLRQLAHTRIELQFARALDQAQTSARDAHAELQRESELLRLSLSDNTRQTHAEWASRWFTEAVPILSQLASFEAHATGPAFSPNCIPAPDWSPPETPAHGVRFGQLDVDYAQLLERLPAELPASTRPLGHARLPLLLTFPHHGSLFLETPPSHRSQALGLLNQVVCRILAGSPPGRVSFTVFDPIGLGQSFAGLTHLADEAEHLIHGRLWTQPSQIEERLAELNEHLEKVIQMYLRNEYATIADYNQEAGNIAEKYRFVVLADFPAGFTDVALRRLLNLATSGARCGVFLLIHRDLRQSAPTDFSFAAIRQACLNLNLGNPTIPLNGLTLPGSSLHLDPSPETAALTDFIHRVARSNLDSNRVEVPFNHIAPSPHDFWSGDTTSEIRVPIGRTGATKFQFLALGKATKQHALIAGKTGSGKSTLFHVLITNLALWCPPDQIQFYLVDFKKGVEFKCYATHRLPHARVVAIESDREFGLSVLQRLDEELRLRGERFREAQVQDLASYRKSPAASPMPRILLLVDEFQEFFVEEDRVAQNASVLLDRIVRQGRAFGIHVVLGSQTLGGAYTVARTTLGQMVVRIALQCNEADAMLIMDEENPAPRLLSRPGEGIYNDAAGAKTGNSPFQVVWLPDDVRDQHLRHIRHHADLLAPDAPVPLVYEGDAPADVADNPDLRRCLSTPSSARSHPTLPRCWLGAPNSIKGPTEITLARRSADNLLVVGQRDDALLALLGIALVGLAAQFPPDQAQFFLLDGSAPDSPDRTFLDRLVTLIPQPVTLARGAQVTPAMLQIGDRLRAASASESDSQSLSLSHSDPAAPTTTTSSSTQRTFVLVHGLQNLRPLRPEDEFAFNASDATPTPSAIFKDLVHEGPARGLHVLASCDTYNNVSRFLGRKTLAEFGFRTLFQMSANDSASLIDNPAASRLGFHRALLYQDREGSIEIFRPYSVPTPDWIAAAAVSLGRNPATNS